MNNNRTTIIILLGVLLTFCLCIGAVGVWVWSTINSSIPAQPAATAGPGFDPLPTNNPEATNSSAAPTEGGTPDRSEFSPETISEMETIQQQVIALRGLQPAGDFSRAIFSPEELRERVINDFFADYSQEEAADDARVLSIFGLLDPDYDLVGLYQELFSEQIAGFYDNETKEMVVVGSGDFGAPEKLTYAHEYDHALQDENYDLEDGLGYNDETCEVDTERCAAIQALIEGDATLLEIQWFLQYASQEDRQELFEYYSDLSSPVFETAPAFLQEDFIFPYNEGYLFVEYLFNDGGWDAVDAAYANLPTSTEQILHPEKYPAESAATVELPDLLPLLGDGWELLDSNVMGEWYTYLILGFGEDPTAQLNIDQAAEAAAGWGGDRYAVYLQRDTGQLAMMLLSVWDSSQDEVEYAAAFKTYADLRFGAGGSAVDALVWESGNGVHLFSNTSNGTLWLAAPDLQTAETMLAAIQ